MPAPCGGIPVAGCYRVRSNFDAMLSRIAEGVGGRIKAHRRGVEERSAKDVGMIMLHPAWGVSDLGEARGVALGKAVAPEALDLLEGPLGKVLRIATLDHAADELVVEMRYPARELEGRHRAAELVGFGGRKSRANDRDLNPLFLEEGHAARLLAHTRECG